jgi:uridine phosphorylase
VVCLPKLKRNAPIPIRSGTRIARETEAAIVRARDLGTLAVEMEAAALYAFSATSGHSLVRFAHATNSMAQTVGYFEKGEADGAKSTLAVVAAAARGWRSYET